MKYLGSKRRIAKYIVPIMLEVAKRKAYNLWAEPFVGGGNIIDKIPNSYTRFGYDINPHTIEALKDVRDFANNLPNECSEEYYNSIKGTTPKHITSWLRYVASFGGKFEGGYARGFSNAGYARNFIEEAKSNALKQSPNLHGVILLCSDYSELYFEDALIYCDPPYKNTTKYKTNPFNYEHFYIWCRNMSKAGNTVFVSEYNMPDDFKVVWEGHIKTNFASTRSEPTHNALEKLYLL